jgi:hypothetical protein
VRVDVECIFILAGRKIFKNDNYFIGNIFSSKELFKYQLLPTCMLESQISKSKILLPSAGHRHSRYHHLRILSTRAHFSFACFIVLSFVESFLLKMARQLLNRTTIFSALSDTFKDEMASIMSPIEAPAGHIFTKEGEEITQFIVVESGSLIRTKASADKGEPLVLDRIGENGVTGFMHVAARDSGVAYATITAGEDGAKVYVVGVEFDQLLR